MFSTDFIFRQQENFVDNQKCQAEFRPLCNKILFLAKIILESLPNKKKQFVLRKKLFILVIHTYIFSYKGIKLYIHVTLLLEFAEFAKMALNFKEPLAKSTKNLYVL